MAELAATSIISGPAFIELGVTPDVLYTEGDIVIDWIQPTFDKSLSIFGHVTTRVADRMAKITFVHSGEWEAASKGQLFPYLQVVAVAPTVAKPGTSIFSGKAMVIRPINGVPITFLNVAVTKMPPILFSGVKSLIGAVEFTAISVDALAWTAASSYYTIAGSAAVTDFTAYNEALILTQPYKAAWGSVAGFTDLDSEEGFIWDSSIQLKPFRLDTRGTVDMRLMRIDATLQAKIVQPTEAQLLTAAKQTGTGSIIGRSLVSDAFDFVIGAYPTGPGTPFFTAKNMYLADWKWAYGEGGRFANTVFKSVRKTAGTPPDLVPLAILA